MPLQCQTPSASYILPNLDIEYLMKSTAVISSEMELEELLKKILNVAVECSGAQHGYLLVEEEGDLVICAESYVSDNGAVKKLNTRLEDVQEICKAIVRYVYRTGKRAIFNDAFTECMLRNSPDCLGYAYTFPSVPAGSQSNQKQ